ncbi:DMT family transporter [Acetobacter sp.]|jgi:drug/metabolite transporter (DMT)-like permease|uniref:DMT family transporter n=1 Tax=Acetobacter sp. TaxID=440 RepID=UPI0025BB7428|nr:DMT family transporter [Acetobacter sp.]MCH4091652.1 DMT family transporter [Acetobacter sp.]MCI1300930.1 DMT family transporter [Acetobacter sp.]MCI1316193.1 DMT family transporter [Acetobacter sp.]
MNKEAGTQAGVGHNIPAGILYGTGAGALWGLIFLAPKLVQDFTPLQLSAGRYLAYGAIASIMIIPRWKNLRFNIRKQDLYALFRLSLFGNILYYILLSMAVQKGGIALTSLIIGFLPVTITVIGSRDKGAVGLSALLPSLMLCIAGTICIGWQAIASPDASTQSMEGLSCAIAALAAWTFYAVENSRCLLRLHTISIHDWNLLMGLMTGLQAVLLTPAALVYDHLQHRLDEWIKFGIISLGVAIIASIFGNALWNRMSRLLPLTMTGQMILFETFFALIYGFLWEQKWPYPLEVAAFVFIVFSVLTCISPHQKQTVKIRSYTASSAENTG